MAFSQSRSSTCDEVEVIPFFFGMMLGSFEIRSVHLSKLYFESQEKKTLADYGVKSEAYSLLRALRCEKMSGGEIKVFVSILNAFITFIKQQSFFLKNNLQGEEKTFLLGLFWFWQSQRNGMEIHIKVLLRLKWLYLWYIDSDFSTKNVQPQQTQAVSENSGNGFTSYVKIIVWSGKTIIKKNDGNWWNTMNCCESLTWGQQLWTVATKWNNEFFMQIPRFCVHLRFDG